MIHNNRGGGQTKGKNRGGANETHKQGGQRNCVYKKSDLYLARKARKAPSGLQFLWSP